MEVVKGIMVMVKKAELAVAKSEKSILATSANIMLANEITRENIEIMVMHFYRSVLKDDVVGPFFIGKLGDDLSNDFWKPHLRLLIDFWASIALNDASYRGNPFAPHMSLGELKRETFEQWLNLFYATVDEVYEPQIADQFKERSSVIAGNFMRNLGLL